ncbi:Zinc transporter ZIP1 [Armadillidium nasatum]|uniref:Zinc transporter ZIP1 n=2 Tax=Armadillidium nasatum TaxID=96803 RepID=A0A5N5TGL1_9CRUS|nr:Zinc transporter ZIP1 [Armadillidium nasatum]
MNIIFVKSAALVLMFIVTFICSSIPVFFVNHIHHTHDSRRRSTYQSILSYLSCIAGGVFMGTCILDLFPDVQEQIDILLSQYAISRPFPVAEFIVVFGFLLVLTLEQSVLDYKEKSFLRNTETDSQGLLTNSQNFRSDILSENRLVGVTDSAQFTVSIRSGNLPVIVSANNHRSPRRSCDEDDGHQHDDVLDHSTHLDISSHSPLRSFLLLFALSLHSVFEGMAVGLQSTIDNVLALFMVVIFHKGTLALSLSINMVQSKLTIKQVVGIVEV